MHIWPLWCIAAGSRWASGHGDEAPGWGPCWSWRRRLSSLHSGAAAVSIRLHLRYSKKLGRFIKICLFYFLTEFRRCRESFFLPLNCGNDLQQVCKEPIKIHNVAFCLISGAQRVDYISPRRGSLSGATRLTIVGEGD